MKRCLPRGHAFESSEWVCPVCGWHPDSVDGFLAFSPELARKNDGFAEEFFAELARLEQNHFWFESRNRLLLWALRRFFPNAGRLLEIGCGTGFVLTGIRARFPELCLAGSEIFATGLTFASTRLPGIDLFQMDARAVPFEREFDVVGAFDVLEHIEEDELVLREMYRAVRPGGGIVITVPQHRALWSALDDFSCHKRRYTRSELVRKTVAAGFEIVYTSSFVSILLPLQYMSRWRKRSGREAGFDPHAELKMGSGLNRLLLTMMNLERTVIERGVRLPVGGSLLLVAKRG